MRQGALLNKPKKKKPSLKSWYFFLSRTQGGKTLFPLQARVLTNKASKHLNNQNKTLLLLFYDRPCLAALA